MSVLKPASAEVDRAHWLGARIKAAYFFADGADSSVSEIEEIGGAAITRVAGVPKVVGPCGNAVDFQNDADHFFDTGAPGELETLWDLGTGFTIAALLKTDTASGTTTYLMGYREAGGQYLGIHDQTGLGYWRLAYNDGVASGNLSATGAATAPTAYDYVGFTVTAAGNLGLSVGEYNVTAGPGLNFGSFPSGATGTSLRLGGVNVSGNADGAIESAYIIAPGLTTDEWKALIRDWYGPLKRNWRGRTRRHSRIR